MKVELHVHTRFSKDSILALWILYFMCRIRRIDVIGITDHNTIKGGVEFFKRFDPRSQFKSKYIRGIDVIVGSEIMTDCGEIIGLFLKEEIPKGLSLEKTIMLVKEQGGVVYLPHPYDQKRRKTVIGEEYIEKFAALIDCCECYNGRNVDANYGDIQESIADKYLLKKIVGSDAHTVYEVGRNYLEIPAGTSVESSQEFVDALCKGELHKEKCLLFAHKITKVAKGIKLILGGNINEVYRIILKKIERGM